MTELPAIAVIADAHFHDLHSDYGCGYTSIDGKQLTLRSWQDTRRSSRVFNESGKALKAALSDIQQRGVRHVVLLGDYTDDGQIESTKRLTVLLNHYRSEYDMAFYAIPGNHDFYGPSGKHQSTRFINDHGSTLVTSDPEVAATESDTAVLTKNMYCEGSPAGLLPMADFGLFNHADYLHWETPFGKSDKPEARMYDAQSADGSAVHSLMDASYLVEPSEGVWLLMIDANVFEPRNGRTDPTRKSTFINSSDAGWNSVLRVKPFLLDWIKDVCTRAKATGKQLIAFSHYPAIDPIDHQTKCDARLFGQSEIVRRSPDALVANALIAAGLNLHFSGHMHVDNTTHYKRDGQTLTDIAVPSLVSFPACYKLIHPSSRSQGCRIDTIAIGAMPIDQTLIDYYRANSESADADAGIVDGPALNSKTYGEFLYNRVRTRVKHHYLIKEWPADIACEINKATAADLAYLLIMAQTSPSKSLTLGAMKELITPELVSDLDAAAALYELTHKDFEACSMIALIADWYCLRQAGPIARSYIKPKNQKLYACLSELTNTPKSKANSRHVEFLNLFIDVLKHSLSALGVSDQLAETHFTTFVPANN